jgi:hypothetical protein
MLKKGQYLLIGLPNIMNLNYILNLISFGNKRAQKHSITMLNHYNKAQDHINAWDPYHFIALVSSCGFQLIRYLPTEGTPIWMVLKRIPVIGQYIYILPFQTRFSYTMFFLFKKVKFVEIAPMD